MLKSCSYDAAEQVAAADNPCVFASERRLQTVEMEVEKEN
jgi:hypothetical protein